MKTKRFWTVMVTLTAVLTLAGCGCFQQAMRGETAPPPPAAVEVQAAPPPQEKAEIPVTPPPREEAAVAPAAVAPAAVPETVLEDIHFDFDKYEIRPGDATILTENSGWFKAHDGARVRIEGNCDERGTVEYNLVLGQRRADATKSYLATLGVDGERLDTVSYGKEKPMDPGHNEEAWAKNRRAHFEQVK